MAYNELLSQTLPPAIKTSHEHSSIRFEMKTHSYHEYLATAHRIADCARALIKKDFRHHSGLQIKPDGSPVTRTDLEVEEAARAAILKNHPDHEFFGEETGHTGHSHEWLWVIDPIDGTRSYATGKHTFGTLIALLHHGSPVIGIIDQAILEERWVGIAGQAALYNDQPCSASKTQNLSQARLCITSPDMFDPIQQIKAEDLSDQCGFRVFGGDCYNYGLLALGCNELVCEASLKPYDYMALVPIIEGAGGAIRDWNGELLNINSCGEVLAAANPVLLEQALSVLNPH